MGTASQRRLPEFQGRSSFGTWTYRIVTNRCLNVLRARRPTAPLEEAGDIAAAEHSTSPARITEAWDAVRELRRALDVLSPGQRACWVLREPDGRSYEFVAEAVGISQEAVRGTGLPRTSLSDTSTGGLAMNAHTNPSSSAFDQGTTTNSCRMDGCCRRPGTPGSSASTTPPPGPARPAEAP